ncbi:hypothetical protein GN956_G2342 [Arapaima gigas]
MVRCGLLLKGSMLDAALRSAGRSSSSSGLWLRRGSTLLESSGDTTAAISALRRQAEDSWTPQVSVRLSPYAAAAAAAASLLTETDEKKEKTPNRNVPRPLCVSLRQ